MKIYLHELSEDATELQFSEADAWVQEVIHEAEESPIREKLNHSINLNLRRSSDVVFLKGKLHITLGLLCSRCANHLDHLIHSSFESMFTNEKGLSQEFPSTSGIAYSEPTNEDGTGLEIEVLEKDYIELSDVIKEQVYLQKPVQPLCKTDCKGICVTCGQNQNTDPCQCHRIRSTALAQGLKDYQQGLKDLKKKL